MSLVSRVLCGCSAAILLALVSAAPPPSRPDVLPGASVVRVADIEARCADGTVLKLQVLHDNLTLKTDYGKFRIPVARIKRIECATRIPADIKAKVEKAIEKLGD